MSTYRGPANQRVHASAHCQALGTGLICWWARARVTPAFVEGGKEERGRVGARARAKERDVERGWREEGGKEEIV